MNDKPKILILDGGTVNPGDISWAALEELGSLQIYDSSEPEQVLERIEAGGAGIVLTNKCRLDAGVLRQCPGLRYINLFATGYNNIDTAAARELGITVCNVPDYGSHAVAQMVFAMILHFSNEVSQYSAEVRQGKWSQSKSFCYWNKPLIELKDKYLGLVGFGSIARRVSLVAEALGMKLLCHSRSSKPGWPQVEFVAFEELLGRSDFISIHCPLLEQTRGLFKQESLKKMKKSAYLINTARGPIVDESAVRKALEQQLIAGFATDVAAREPIPSDSPLLGAPNCVITPHIAWAPRETRQRLLEIVAANIRSFLNGQPQNQVN